MKIIVVGLGTFGSSIATKLTLRGNEVIGIDNDINKVEYYKEKYRTPYAWMPPMKSPWLGCP